MINMPKRKLTPYESTQLRRYKKVALLDADLGSTPVEYLTGKAEFADLVLEVSPAVLIPRVETEALVARAVELVLTRKYEAVADVGTGCGAIALGLAHALVQNKKTPKNVSIIASDISQDALTVAQQNLDKYSQLATIVTLTHSDLLESFADHSLDLIIANLPYIPHDILDKLDDSVRSHEPHIALDGGAEGFELIAKFMKQIPTKLRPRGSILLEMDYTHTPDLFKPWNKKFQINFFSDYRDVPRFAQLDLQ